MVDPSSGPVDLVALPVAISAPRHLVDQVGAWLEAHLGWQVTTGTALPPRLRLVAVGGDGTTEPDGPAVPTIALVGADDDPVAATRLADSVEAIVAWPEEHDRLAALAADLLGGQPEPEVEVLRLGGAAGGVGTTTVALGVAAGFARRGTPCLAVVHGDVPVPDVRCVGPEVLAGHRAWAAAVEAPHVPGLRVVEVDRSVGSVAVPAGVFVVLDGGVGEHVDVLVVRRTRAGLAAVERSSAAAVAVIDRGPRSRRQFRMAAGGRPVVDLPWSARVARQHDACGLPAGLPGSFLAALQPLVDLDEPAVLA